MATKKPIELVLSTCECKRCGHLWPTKLQGREPLICPKCRSIYWNSEKQFVPKREVQRVKELLMKLKQREVLA